MITCLEEVVRPAGGRLITRGPFVIEGFAICPVRTDPYSGLDFASVLWPVRPPPALSSVKLLNTFFTVSHNIASDQRMYSLGREERQ